MSTCIFCEMAEGRMPCHKIWEDQRHMAFLSNKPNTEGFTVLIVKEHFESNFVRVPGFVLASMMVASQHVSKILTRSFSDVGAVGLIVEGFGVNHLHFKLTPLHGTPKEGWRQILSTSEEMHPTYEGFISSNAGKLVSDMQLAVLAKTIRQLNGLDKK